MFWHYFTTCLNKCQSFFNLFQSFSTDTFKNQRTFISVHFPAL
ncbi:hypothetical protein HMP0721_0029 [Pseudoramibacter alactolyticus ATCC 23263]|uniref:Uncharacterized protein n=1 Tax=Pseudoramibacter alactolyticus ATCC 23263 TaxID=887929 RepID=E6MDE7_9FIRM|nr:hypothetical protein HMP0721_0029 [Pseudoramibacter alactolyticus ATCC 23263]